MSGRWLETNKSVFVRDIVRDYCKVCLVLEEQQQRFEGDGTISYAALRELLGESMRKGVFWRLKDTAHLLFRRLKEKEPLCADRNKELLPSDMVVLWQYAGLRVPDGLVWQSGIEAMLDWCVGYAFHECVKLKEDAFLQQHYANRYAEILHSIQNRDGLFSGLNMLTAQTCESIQREIMRIMHVLDQGRTLLMHYLAEQGGNRYLARLLYVESSAIKRVFRGQYGELLQSLYGDAPERMYIGAALSFWEGGRVSEALTVLDDAEQRYTLGEQGRVLRDLMGRQTLPPEEILLFHDQRGSVTWAD